MVELTLLALLHHLKDWGCSPVIASRVLPADATTLRALVADPASQWRLVAGISPLLRPRAHVAPSHSSRLVSVNVQLRGRDVLWITWILAPGRGTTAIDLAAQIESRGPLARVVLAFGGRRWLRHRLERTLALLAALAHAAAEDFDDLEAGAAPATRPRRARPFGTTPPRERHDPTPDVRHRRRRPRRREGRPDPARGGL